MTRRKPREWESTFPEVAPALLKVLEIYRKSTKRNNLRYGQEYCEKLKDVKKQTITRALSIYQKKAELDGKAPHPNYFIATCLSLDKEIHAGVGRDENEPLIIMGRLI